MSLDTILIALLWLVAEFIGGPLVGLIVCALASLGFVVFRWIGLRLLPIALLIDSLIMIGLSSLGFWLAQQGQTSALVLVTDAVLLYTLLDVRRSALSRPQVDLLPRALQKRVQPELIRASLIIMLKPMLLGLAVHAVLAATVLLLVQLVPQFSFLLLDFENLSTAALIGVVVLAYIVALASMRAWARRSPEDRELLALVDRRGRMRGADFRYRVHDPKHPRRHAVVRLVLLHESGEILLQKRATSKKSFPACWDSAVAGHVQAGETLEQALGRESVEELGVRFDPVPGSAIATLSGTEADSELAWIYLTKLATKPSFRPNPVEVQTLRFWKPDELSDALNASPDSFTPGLKQELDLLRQKGLF